MSASPVKAARFVFQSTFRPEAIDPITPHVQSKVAAWQKRNFGDQPMYRQVLGALEELGELAHAVLKQEQGIRGMDSEEAFLEAAGDAIADTTIFLMQIATNLRLDFTTLVLHTASEVTKREWNKAPSNVSAHPYDKPGIHDS